MDVSLDIPDVAIMGGPPFPWLPTAGGALPTLFADFTTEGTTNHYWFNGAKSASFAAWLTAISGTVVRAGVANYTKGGVVFQAGSATARFPTDTSGIPLGMRVTPQAQTELCLQNRDLTNVLWTATTATVAKDQTGADGSATAASSVLATAGNATVLQTITSAVNTRITGAFVKRLIGTGEIDITQDNGVTWTPISITGSYVFYTLPAASGTNPVVGFRIVTNGDKIAVDFVSHRLGSFIYDPIATTTVTVTQVADQIKASTSGWLSTSGTLVVDVVQENTSVTCGCLAINANGGALAAPNAFSHFLNIGANYYQAGGQTTPANFTGSTSNPQKIAGIFDVPSTLQRVVADGGHAENSTLDFTATASANQLQFGAPTSTGSSGFFGNMRAVAFYPVATSVVQAQALLAVMP